MLIALHVFLFAAVSNMAMTMTTDTLSSTETLVHIGTYTGKGSKGIYACRLDTEAGTLGTPQLVAEAKNPSYLCVSPERGLLFTVNEIADFRGKSGAVSSYRIDPVAGQLSLINMQPTGGRGACYVSMDSGAKHLFVANYGSGSVAVVPVDETGKLSPPASVMKHEGSSINPARQKEPHAHSFVPSPDGRYAFAADLGIDKIMAYRLDQSSGILTTHDHGGTSVAPGSGPRHLAFHPSGKFAYATMELSNEVVAFNYDATSGSLKQLQAISMLPPGFDQTSHAAEVRVHPSGRFVYASNRGHDSIAIFSVEPETGKLTAVGHEPTQGKTPRGFTIHPNGKLLLVANQESDVVVVFRIDEQSGRLEPTGSTQAISSPASVAFLSR